MTGEHLCNLRGRKDRLHVTAKAQIVKEKPNKFEQPKFSNSVWYNIL